MVKYKINKVKTDTNQLGYQFSSSNNKSSGVFVVKHPTEITQDIVQTALSNTMRPRDVFVLDSFKDLPKKCIFNRKMDNFDSASKTFVIGRSTKLENSSFNNIYDTFKIPDYAIIKNSRLDNVKIDKLKSLKCANSNVQGVNLEGRNQIGFSNIKWPDDSIINNSVIFNSNLLDNRNKKAQDPENWNKSLITQSTIKNSTLVANGTPHKSKIETDFIAHSYLSGTAIIGDNTISNTVIKSNPDEYIGMRSRVIQDKHINGADPLSNLPSVDPKIIDNLVANLKDTATFEQDINNYFNGIDPYQLNPKKVSPYQAVYTKHNHRIHEVQLPRDIPEYQAKSIAKYASRKYSAEKIAMADLMGLPDNVFKDLKDGKVNPELTKTVDHRLNLDDNLQQTKEEREAENDKHNQVSYYSDDDLDYDL